MEVTFKENNDYTIMAGLDELEYIALFHEEFKLNVLYQLGYHLIA